MAMQSDCIETYDALLLKIWYEIKSSAQLDGYCNKYPNLSSALKKCHIQIERMCMTFEPQSIEIAF